MIAVKSFTFNPFQENTYVISDSSKKCIIIDPGCYEPRESEILMDYIKQIKCEPEFILLTHGHIDHILGNYFLSNHYGLSIHAHEGDNVLIQGAPQWGLQYGIAMQPSPLPSIFINENDSVVFGESKLQIFHTPGHSPGSLSFYSPENEFVISGDVLFKGGIGRTDLYQGNYDTLIQAIKEKLFTLPPSTKVYSGHGPATTIGYEMRNNPFFN